MNLPDTQTPGMPSPQQMRRLSLHFSGEVQGVGFRWTSRKVAQGLGLTGWVRNEPDGSVSMELQGASGQIGCFFTLFDRQYANYFLRYVIDDREDIPIVRDERDFMVRF